MNPVKPRLLIFAILAVGAARGAAAQYVPIDLGTIGGNTSVAVAVNNNGQVVGTTTPPGTLKATHSHGQRPGGWPIPAHSEELKATPSR